MGRLPAWVRFGCLLCLFASAPLRAENTRAWTATGEAYTWLNKIQAAARGLSYSGSFVYQQGSQLRTSRISHLREGKNEYEKLEILDGEPREYVRSNDELVSYFPQTKIATVERRPIKYVFPAMLSVDTGEIGNYYQARVQAPDRVAGYDCHTISLEPKDQLRYGYRFCAEVNSGLLLRAQVLNERHEVVEQIAFVTLTIGNVPRKSVKPSYNAQASDWQTETASVEPVRASGWQIGWMPPGFKKTHEVVRRVRSEKPLSARGGSASAGGLHAEAAPGRQVWQLVYSDGLAAISIFIEAGNGRLQDEMVQRGATNLLGKRQGEFSLMIVGEVPPAAIKKISNSIEYRPQ